MQEWVASKSQYKRGVHAPCGSIKIKNLRFNGMRGERNSDTLLDLTLDFTLQIYKFKPFRLPGSSGCRPPSQNTP